MLTILSANACNSPVLPSDNWAWFDDCIYTVKSTLLMVFVSVMMDLQKQTCL